MYRNTASTYVTAHNSLPSPDYTGDSDSDSEIIKELQQKRRQLDEEVARFKIQKEKEFKDFEVELKSRKKQRRSQSHQNHVDYSCHEYAKQSPSTTPPYKFSASPHIKNGRTVNAHHTRQSSASILLMKPISGPKVTNPTISLDHTNIRGETIQQSHALPTPPTPSAVPSSTTHDVTAILDQSKPPSKQLPTPDEHHEHTFDGVFVPSYLPLLESANDQESEILVQGTQTEPASPTDRFTIDSMSVHASSLPLESSISNDFQVTTSKRSYTSPSTTKRTVLPPIIRNVNGKKRANGKRKHVTFQLADRAIVEPSSSYEEGPSPDVDIEEKDSNNSTRSTTPENESPRPTITRRSTPLDPFGRRKKNLKPQETSPDEIGMGMGDLLLSANNSDSEFLPEEDIKEAQVQSTALITEEGYFSPRHGTGTVNIEAALQNAVPPDSQVTEPEAESFNSFNSVDDDAYLHKRRDLIKQRSSGGKTSEERISKTGTLSDLGTAMLAADKPTSPQRQTYPGSLEDSISATNNVGFFELDEELASPDAGNPEPYNAAATDGLDDLGDVKSRTTRQNRNFPGDMLTGTSVPIDIVRPGNSFVSNSWIGTFGH